MFMYWPTQKRALNIFLYVQCIKMWFFSFVHKLQEHVNFFVFGGRTLFCQASFFLMTMPSISLLHTQNDKDCPALMSVLFFCGVVKCVIQSIYVIHVLKTIPNMSVSIVYVYVTSHFFFFGWGRFVHICYTCSQNHLKYVCMYKICAFDTFSPLFFWDWQGFDVLHIYYTCSQDDLLKECRTRVRKYAILLFYW